MPKKMFLVDGSNQAFRAHFAIQGDMRAQDGFPTKALFGFASMLHRISRELKPDYLIIVFDRGLSFRNELYPDYKGQRPDMPEDLRAQWPEFEPFCEEWGIKASSMVGFEADDIIGTLAVRYAGPELDVRIISSDKDFCQLVNDHIHILDVGKDEELDPAKVIEKWGVPADKIIDLLSLMGDNSDNVPGVAGVGEKKAAKFIQTYGSAEAVLDNASKIGGKTGETIAASRDIVALARKLVTIHTDVPLSFGLEDLIPRKPDYAALESRLKRYNFKRMLATVQAELGVEATVPTGLDRSKYRAITTPEELRWLVSELRDAGRFAYDSETTSLDPQRAELVGMSFAWNADFGVYVPIGHLSGQNCPNAVETLAPLLAEPTLKKTGQNLKYDLSVLRARGLDLAGIDGDTMLADYLLDVDRKHGLDELALRHLDHRMIAFKDVTALLDGEFCRVSLERATEYAAEDAHVAWLLDQKLQLGPVEPVYRDIELPLISVLADMELRGIRVDVPALLALSKELEGRLQIAVEAVYAEAGETFNLNSTQQLAVILFEKRGLASGKKTKTGYSTDADTLEKLATEGDKLCQLMLDYRELAKLKSTYVDALPKTVSPVDGRIHSSFHQAVAATGRLSSNEPNLQNIPIRTPEGRRIRACFVPDPGFRFVSADYSQIELRVLAHFCGEGPLVEAFKTGQDIHRRTAAEVFGVAPALVSNEQRRAAKAINFGIVYGMSAFRLANDLRISRRIAQDYIDGYFARYPQVKSFMEQAIEKARSLGYAETLYGRRRPVRGLDARSPVDRGAAERIAINTPVQGTAADLIKLAMIRVHHRLKADFPSSRLLLQVHDELVLEVPEGDVEAVRSAVAEEMAQVASLVVPLVADTGVGDSWDAAH